jgi:hypothetical protein
MVVVVVVVVLALTGRFNPALPRPALHDHLAPT